MKKYGLSLLLFFFSINCCASASTCEMLFLDRDPADGWKNNKVESVYLDNNEFRLSLVSQIDGSLKANNLMSSEDTSALCGSMSLHYLFKAWLSTKNIASSFKNSANEISALEKEMNETYGLSIRDGLYTGNVEAVAESMLKINNIKETVNVEAVDLLSSWQIEPEKVFSVNENELTLVSVTILDPATLQVAGRHFLARVASNPASHELVFIDPMNPTAPLTAKGIVKEDPNAQQMTVQILPDRKILDLPTQHVYVDAVVRIKIVENNNVANKP